MQSIHQSNRRQRSNPRSPTNARLLPLCRQLMPRKSLSVMILRSSSSSNSQRTAVLRVDPMLRCSSLGLNLSNNNGIDCSSSVAVAAPPAPALSKGLSRWLGAAGRSNGSASATTSITTEHYRSCCTSVRLKEMYLLPFSPLWSKKIALMQRNSLPTAVEVIEFGFCFLPKEVRVFCVAL